MFTGAYTPLVPLMLFGWIPIGLLLVWWLRPLKGVIAIFVLGWLLLPVAGYKVEGVPAYTKLTAVALSGLIATIVFDSARIMKFRLSLIDLPMLIWLTCPGISSIANDLGAYDATAIILDQVLTWGIAYLIGRIYLTSHESMRVLATGVVLGGLLYVPLCLYEIVMSPQLHTMFYGFFQHQFAQTRRSGGWRPTVFLQHGLAVALFMNSASVTAVSLWRRKVVPSLLGAPMWLVVGVLITVAIMCKSMGAIALLAVALIVLWIARVSRSWLPVLALSLVAPLYIGVRVPGGWTGDSLVEFVRDIEAERADSLRTRLNSEDSISAHALQQPLFGWGAWGRNMEDKDGRVLAIMDGMWIIVFGKWGIVGLTAMYSSLLVPVVVLFCRGPRSLVWEAGYASSVAMAGLVIMFSIDCLFNAMPNPMYLVAVGGLASVCTLRPGPPAVDVSAQRRLPAGAGVRPDRGASGRSSHR